jgi:hypothetical protein
LTAKYHNVCVCKVPTLLAGTEFGRLTALVSKSLFSLVNNFQQAKENVSGPIAIVGVVGLYTLNSV